jgi:formylglycine-generating enzyme required for sulfatase activity
MIRKNLAHAALAVFFVACVVTAEANTISIDTVLVGDAGNVADTSAHSGNPTGQGAVAYNYQMGTYDVTLSQYTAFLNSVAASDPYALYNTNMATDLNVAGISRSGSSGSYTYAVIGSGQHPVTDVSWFDALRFANWLNNGQGTLASTETGSYTLLGGTPTPSNAATITRNAGAQWVLPTEDEWYKAAYYKSGGTNAGYWMYRRYSKNVGIQKEV